MPPTPQFGRGQVDRPVKIVFLRSMRRWVVPSMQKSGKTLDSRYTAVINLGLEDCGNPNSKRTVHFLCLSLSLMVPHSLCWSYL